MKRIPWIDFGLIFLVGIAIFYMLYDSNEIKKEAKETIIATLEERGYQIEEVSVNMSRGTAIVYTTNGTFYTDKIDKEGLHLYKKELLE